MAHFWRIRRRLLWHLRRDPWMWGLQAMNVLGGLARYATYLGLVLVLAPPVLVFWAEVVWPPAGEPPPRLPFPVPEGGLPAEGGPVLGLLGGIGLAWLVMLDLLLGWRLSRCQNVFVARAERLAWAVLDAETPEEPPAAQSHPRTTEKNRESPM
jgi:hypothetical protein